MIYLIFVWLTNEVSLCGESHLFFFQAYQIKHIKTYTNTKSNQIFQKNKGHLSYITQIENKSKYIKKKNEREKKKIKVKVKSKREYRYINTIITLI